MLRAVITLTLATAASALALQGIRINKVFTSHFSRREADRIVADGRVTLNGRVAVAGDRVRPSDDVTLDGVPFAAAPAFAAAGGRWRIVALVTACCGLRCRRRRRRLRTKFSAACRRRLRRRRRRQLASIHAQALIAARPG